MSSPPSPADRTTRSDHTIGIVAGSGPEAGIDLWQKVLGATRRRRGDRYRGDIDAPRVVVVSEPALGASMGLPATDPEVWPALAAIVAELAPRCRAFAVACNTLNVYAEQVRALDLPAELVAFQDVVAEWATDRDLDRIGLLGARSVAALGAWSPYATLSDRIELVTPADPEPLHSLIEAIKLDGGADPAHGDRLGAIVEDLGTEHVLLACTELPLVTRPVDGVELVDVTALAAEALVERVTGI